MLTLDDLVDYLRFVNCILAALCCSVLVMALMNRWDTLRRRLKHLGMWYVILLAVICYAMVEGVILDLSPRPAIVLYTLVLTGTLHRLVWKFDERE